MLSFGAAATVAVVFYVEFVDVVVDTIGGVVDDIVVVAVVVLLLQ